MLGAILGDIIGSRFEWDNHRSKDFILLTGDCSFTDDSVMTAAVAQALMDCGGNYNDLPERAAAAMRRIGRHYPNCGYGGMFRRWVLSEERLPAYGSFGNGAAMRISPIVAAAGSLEQVRILSRQVTAVTHDHPEGIKGAEAAAVAGYLAKAGASIHEIRAHIHENYYSMEFTLDGIRDSYRFNETCQGTVPQAIMAFLESMDFEDAIRNAISIGGDSDTLAAITGGIAEYYYGIPDDLAGQALACLDEELLEIVLAFYGEGGPGWRKGEGLPARLARVAEMEGIKNRAEQQVARLSGALDEFEAMAEEIGRLKAYYTGAEWRSDLAEDEAGRIPGFIRRGVLSEDGIYDLLMELERLRKRFDRLGKQAE